MAVQAMSALTIVFIAFSIIGFMIVPYPNVFGQKNEVQRDTMTFAANGLIASWSLDNTTDAGIPHVISGIWSLKVVNGSAKEFSANITMVKGDGSDYHTHRLTNFEVENRSLTNTLLRTDGNVIPELQVAPDGTLSVPGRIDITTDDSINWSNVSITVMIRKLHTLNIVIDESATENHFTAGHHPTIYGTVYSLKDKSGNELLQNDS